eukprot:gene12288-13553_t
MACAFQTTFVFLLVFLAFFETKTALSYTQVDFSKNVPQTPHFIMFYAPWCSDCKRMVPLWDKLSEIYRKLNFNAKCVKVDCSEETPLCAQEDIKAYPTLRFFNGEQKKTYRDGRNVADFLRFTKAELHYSDTVIVDDQVFEIGGAQYERVMKEGLRFVNFYAPWCKHCQRLAPIWKRLSQELQHNKDIQIVKVNCDEEKEICNLNNVNAYPSLIMFHQGMQVIHYQGDHSFDELLSFARQMIHKYVVAMRYTIGDGPNQPVAENQDSFDSDPISAHDAPDTAFNEVITLGQDTFDLAVDSGKTFVYFFAPWCKYCKEFTPIWEQLANKVIEKGLMIKIAKVDCTKEGTLCNQLGVTAFPTITLFKSRFNTEPYKGNRNIEDLYRFLKRHEHDEL